MMILLSENPKEKREILTLVSNKILNKNCFFLNYFILDMREFEQDLADVIDLESVEKDFKSIDMVIHSFRQLK